MAVAFDSPMNTVAFPAGYNWGYFAQTGSGNALFCSEGSVQDTRYVIGAPRSPNANWVPNGINLVVDKTFTCDDGTGSITMRLEIHGVFFAETFHWTIFSGTGAYARLHGQGVGMTDSTSDPNWVENLYTGTLF